MRNILFFLLLFFSVLLRAQGLENVIIEKYYIADANDAAASEGRLKKGAVTYRIFIDLKEGYCLQAVYGVDGHPMRIGTTTGFYNHLLYGGTIANVVPYRILKQDVAMLDSWISMGAASEFSLGVLKQEDDTLYTVKNVFKPVPVLQNHSKKMGIPLYQRDGLNYVEEIPKVNGFGLDSALKIFDVDHTKRDGVVFETSNGSWACMAGAKGPLPSNRVLIAQLTTDGKLFFELNAQIRSDEGVVERYVAKSPRDGERLFPALVYPR